MPLPTPLLAPVTTAIWGDFESCWRVLRFMLLRWVTERQLLVYFSPSKDCYHNATNPARNNSSLAVAEKRELRYKFCAPEPAKWPAQSQFQVRRKDVYPR